MLAPAGAALGAWDAGRWSLETGRLVRGRCSLEVEICGCHPTVEGLGRRSGFDFGGRDHIIVTGVVLLPRGGCAGAELKSGVENSELRCIRMLSDGRSRSVAKNFSSISVGRSSSCVVSRPRITVGCRAFTRWSTRLRCPVRRFRASRARLRKAEAKRPEATRYDDDPVVLVSLT